MQANNTILNLLQLNLQDTAVLSGVDNLSIISDSITLTGTSKLQAKSLLTLTSNNITIGTGSSVSVDLASSTVRTGMGGKSSDSTSIGGGGHGGTGGAEIGNIGGLAYDSYRLPSLPGSPGGPSPYYGSMRFITAKIPVLNIE